MIDSFSILSGRMSALNEGDIFLEKKFILDTVIPQIVLSSCALYAIYFVTSFLFEHYLLSQTKLGLAKRRKLCFQITSACANLLLSVMGVYFEYFVKSGAFSLEEATQGGKEFIFLSTLQIAFQVFSIPIGILHTNESKQMLVHHTAVVVVTGMSAFFRNGFRYWTPFFYGIIEISSLPLAPYNWFKNNPEYSAKYPALFDRVRLTFAFSFLWFRVAMFIPRIVPYLLQQYFLFSTHPSLPYRAFMSVAWICSLVLFFLQMMWGSLITRGLLKRFSGEKSTKKSK